MQPSHTLTRRGFVASAGAAWATASLAPGRLLATDAANAGDGPVQSIRRAGPTASIAVHNLRGNISVLEGSGGNITVLRGADGKLLVDSGVSKANVLAALDSLGKEPVRYLVNSHWHFDHTDGNGWLHRAGATIVAHENTRKRMAMATRVEDWNFTFPPSPTAALPGVAFGDAATLHLNGVAVTIKGYGPAHTDTDVRVTFGDADVFAAGDTWWNGHYPFIDYSTGGSIDGTIRAAEANVDAAGEKTMVVPGHGPVGGKRELTEFRDMLRNVRDAVATLKKQGKSADDAVAAKPTAQYDAKWGGFVIVGDAFTRLVYQGV